jgi:hypothetical protein
MSRIRRFIRRLFLFISMVTGSIASAIDNYEFTVEKELRDKQLEAVNEIPEDAVDAAMQANRRTSAWDDMPLHGPPDLQ